jgi:hypothetical protein
MCWPCSEVFAALWFSVTLCGLRAVLSEFNTEVAEKCHTVRGEFDLEGVE